MDSLSHSFCRKIHSFVRNSGFVMENNKIEVVLSSKSVRWRARHLPCSRHVVFFATQILALRSSDGCTDLYPLRFW